MTSKTTASQNVTNAKALKPALRAIYEASWRLHTILKELPGSPSEINKDGDDSRLPEILKGHGETCLSVIRNALETIDIMGIDVSASESGADVFTAAFDNFKKAPLDLAKAS